MEQNQLPVEFEPQVESQTPSVPWSALESWIGVLLFILIDVGLFIFLSRNPDMQLAQNALIVLAELVYLLPVVIILAWKRISWKSLGFGKFEWSTLGIGCGLLIGGFAINFLHNAIIALLKFDTQGQKILDAFSSMGSPAWFIFTAVVVAPPVEEIFFRGFLFQGFRKRYGWVSALLLSSFIFAAAHLDLVTFIPTFVLGLVLAYVYHRSNSVWPGIILHFLANAFSSCALYFILQFQHLIPL